MGWLVGTWEILFQQVQYLTSNLSPFGKFRVQEEDRKDNFDFFSRRRHRNVRPVDSLYLRVLFFFSLVFA